MQNIGLAKIDTVCKNNGNSNPKWIFTWRNQKFWVKFSRTVNRVWRQPKPLILSPPISSFSIQHKIRSNSPFIPHRFVTVWWIIQKLRHFNNSPFSNINILTINYFWLKNGNCQTKKINKTPRKVMLENGLLTIFPLDSDTFYLCDSISYEKAWGEQLQG